jgi:hypothetical protein
MRIAYYHSILGGVVVRVGVARGGPPLHAVDRAQLPVEQFLK